MNFTKEQLAQQLKENSDLGIDSHSMSGLNATERPLEQARDGWIVLDHKIYRVKTKQATSGQTKRHATIKLDYPGCVITENHAYGRNGKHSFMKTEAREWQNDLIVLVKNCGVKDWRLPLKIRVEGVFKNERECPDLQNMKLVFDGIQQATGLNDKNFHTETIPGVIDKSQRPHIKITVEEL
jgi:hypothetical protein